MNIEDKYEILDVIESGYNSIVFKVQIPEFGLCAVKRLRSKHEFRRSTDNAFAEFFKEIEIYKRLKGLKGFPQIYDFYLDEKALEKNYLIMSWVDGKMVSDLWAQHYDLSLITPEKITKIYHLLLEMDKKGIIHNDLWATNILFAEEDVSIIDFNLGQIVNPLILYEYKHKDYFSNLKVFNRLFLDNFLADVYEKKGSQVFNAFYMHIANCEYDFYKQKAVFMLANNEPQKADYLLKSAMEIKRKINQPKSLEKEGLKRILAFSVKQAFKNKKRENVFKVNYQRVLKIISENPDLLTPKIQAYLYPMQRKIRFIASLSNTRAL